MLWDFPGDPMFKTPHFHSRGMGSIPQWGPISHMPQGVAKKRGE